MPSPKSLHPCKGCKFAQSVQGYMNVCGKPERLVADKRWYYTEINRLACGSVNLEPGSKGQPEHCTSRRIKP